MRIVPLFAGATEIVCALDAGQDLVGRSHECDNPPCVRTLPQLTEPAFDISVSSSEIDREVRRRLQQGEPLYLINSTLICELKPDVVFAQSHCEVCAVTPGDIERNGARIPGARIVALSACTLEDVFENITQIADALGFLDRGHVVARRERGRLNELRRITSQFEKPSVAALEWTDPIFPMSNWGPELVHAAGGMPVMGNPGQHSAAIRAEQLPEVDPEFLVVAPCGFNLRRTVQELPVLESYPWWNQLRAVKGQKVALADGNLFFNRSGMSVVRTAEILGEILQGVVIGERSQNRHWVWSHDAKTALRVPC